MPSAIFHNFVKFSYYHGDEDGKPWDPQTPFRYIEGGSVDLAELEGLMRRGYIIVGWHYEYDGKDYPIFLKIYFIWCWCCNDCNPGTHWI